MTYHNRVHRELSGLLGDVDTNVVVDRMDAIKGAVSGVSVSFHLEGRWGSPARYTFPFAEPIPLAESLSSVRDLISRSWQGAHLPPPQAAEVLDAGPSSPLS